MDATIEIKVNIGDDISDGIVVLSLFDGISCGIVALERAGIKVKKYYASEIDKYAIEISNKNYPQIIQLGDIRTITEDVLESIMPIDIIIIGGKSMSRFE